MAASVGMLFRALDQLAERLGGIGGLLLDILGGLLGNEIGRHMTCEDQQRATATRPR